MAGVGVLTSPAPWSLTPAFASNPNRAWADNFARFDAGAFSGSLATPDVPVVQGKLPADLRGTLYRNGPARFNRGQSHLSHWFDGDGMLQSLRFDAGKVQHLGRLLRTPKLEEEDAAGRFLYGSFGSTVANPAPVTNADAMNPGNINVLPINGGKTLYALWEAGSAIQVDPDNLQTLGIKQWSPQTAHAPFGAHPRVGPDGDVWNFGYLPGVGKVLLYHIADNGQLKRQTVLSLPQCDLVHDFAVTENHLVFLLQPLVFKRVEGQTPNLLAGMHWESHAPLLACVIRKSDWSFFLADLPAGGVFHMGNSWEDGGVIRLGYSRQADMMTLMNGLRVQPRDKPTAIPLSHWTDVEIALDTRQARQDISNIAAVEFPRWDQRRTGAPTNLTVMVERPTAMNSLVPGFAAVLSKTGEQVQRYNYGDGWIAEEHLYVPHPTRSAEADGWIVGSAYHWPTEKTAVSVFGAAHLSDGPVARLQLPYALPLGLHGQFVPA